ncbi:SDR family NAD(P)-dependent oxidoreductase [Nakamurella leprariae]|uniref:SDR family NAD(P)-dependent oxidoreductase n=1 Tax=Nakamurella leprariae TaxID=2803911 RepID=A0A938Y4J9_9ACTN|nr:SDR family NAD(P)-dependent oxidoreductase [Nakamurella leprariae]MBM9465946.1 SDR family NAD(P)-dependent oxidoreductase [Nakamurella leprariae]
MELQPGQTAVITGGGSGIGREIALAFAREGLHIVVSDIDQARAQAVADEAAALGVRSLAVEVDTGDAASVEALADAAYAAFGAVNVLCNNAGILQMGPIMEASQDDWEWLFRVNLWGVLNGVRTFVPRMRAQGSPAHVVNTSSLSGVFAVRNLGVYTAAKYGVVAISETMKIELDDIGVSVLCPGPTPSQITQEMRGTVGDAPASSSLNLGQRDAAVVAQCVIDGIKADRFYLFSHSTGQGPTEARFNAMLDGFAVAP